MMWLLLTSLVSSLYPNSLQLLVLLLCPRFTELHLLFLSRHRAAHLWSFSFFTPSAQNALSSHLPPSTQCFRLSFLDGSYHVFFILALPTPSAVPGIWWTLFSDKLCKLFMVRWLVTQQRAGIQSGFLILNFVDIPFHCIAPHLGYNILNIL